MQVRITYRVGNCYRRSVVYSHAGRFPVRGLHQSRFLRYSFVLTREVWEDGGVNQEKALRQLDALRKRGETMRLAAEEWKEEWQTLIAILMSARTLDETTIEVGERLFKAYPTVKGLAEAPQVKIARIINRVNFFQNKAKYVVGCAKVLHEKYDGKPPHTLEELTELPGVGRKTANVFLAEYGHQAIGVDTHVSYIAQKLGWTRHTDPVGIERDLTALFPEKYWNQINQTLVHFGKTHTSRREKDALLETLKQL